jgi:hypothetical protein
LHAALAQGLEFFGAVDVVRNELTVDLEPHGVKVAATGPTEGSKVMDVAFVDDHLSVTG